VTDVAVAMNVSTTWGVVDDKLISGRTELFENRILSLNPVEQSRFCELSPAASFAVATNKWQMGRNGSAR
jgi:hypothetical protein